MLTCFDEMHISPSATNDDHVLPSFQQQANSPPDRRGGFDALLDFIRI